MTEMEPAPASAAEPVPGKSINWTLLAKRVWSFCVRCIKRVKLTRLFKEVLTFTTTSLLLLVIIAIIIAAHIKYQSWSMLRILHDCNKKQQQKSMNATQKRSFHQANITKLILLRNPWATALCFLKVPFHRK